MKANRARNAVYLSLAMGLAACGGGGGGGGGGDDGSEPPASFGDFDGNYTLRGTNEPMQPFNRTFAANFVDGEATVEGVETRFDYPLDPQSGGCFFDRGSLDTCNERAAGHVLALCGSSRDDNLTAVGVRDDRAASFTAVPLSELRTVATANGTAGLQFQAVSCANALDANDTVTVLGNGQVRQVAGGVTTTLQENVVTALFLPTGVGVDAPPANVGALAFKHVVNGETTYYIVNFGAETRTAQQGGESFPPALFVSVN